MKTWRLLRISAFILFGAFWAFAAFAQPVVVPAIDGLCTLTFGSTRSRGVIADGMLITVAHNLMPGAGGRVERTSAIKIQCTRDGKMVPVELASAFKITRAYKDFRKRFGPGSEAAITFDVTAAPIKKPFPTPFILLRNPNHRMTQFLVATLRASSVSDVQMQIHFAKKLKKYRAYNGGPSFYMSDGFPEVGLGDSGSPLYVESGENKVLLGIVSARNETPQFNTFTDVDILRRPYTCAALTSNE